MADAPFTGSGWVHFRKMGGALITGFFIVSLISCSSKHTATDSRRAHNTAVASIRFFQNVISPVDGDRCNMRPSCSQYAIDAVSGHGLLMGWIMSCDRLIRCGRDETGLSPMEIKGDETYCMDPLKNNDFWWYHRQP